MMDAMSVQTLVVGDVLTEEYVKILRAYGRRATPETIAATQGHSLTLVETVIEKWCAFRADVAKKTVAEWDKQPKDDGNIATVTTTQQPVSPSTPVVAKTDTPTKTKTGHAELTLEVLTQTIHAAMASQDPTIRNAVTQILNLTEHLTKALAAEESAIRAEADAMHKAREEVLLRQIEAIHAKAKPLEQQLDALRNPYTMRQWASGQGHKLNPGDDAPAWLVREWLNSLPPLQ